MTPEEVLFRPAHERADRAHLIAVQRLYIKLLYCEDANRQYEADPAAWLASCGLDASAASMLPDVASVNHKAERHGRRIQAANELANALPRTMSAALDGAPPISPRVAGAPFLARFLSSDEFSGRSSRLPHPLGIGAGYENISAFFFWARRELLAARPALRTPLYEEFGQWLVRAARSGREPALDRFRRGVFFVREPGVAAVVTARQIVDVTEESRVAEQLAAKGFCDLDELAP